mgnify:CR=1 FL=1
MDRPPVGKVEDLATLAKLDEQVLLAELKTRYYNNDIYVSVLSSFTKRYQHKYKLIHLAYI